MTQGLNYWRSNGVGGHRLSQYIHIPPALSTMKRIIAGFGIGIISMGLNQSVIQAFQTGQLWATNYGPATEYHCVPLVAYDDNYVECVTWGRLQRMTWAFFGSYVMEAFIPVGPEMFKPDGLSFSGRNQQQMLGLANSLILDLMAI